MERSSRARCIAQLIDIYDGGMMGRRQEGKRESHKRLPNADDGKTCECIEPLRFSSKLLLV